MSSILVVDDNARVLDSLERALTSFSHTVVGVGDANEAIAALGSVEFGVAFVDIKLPGVNGHGLMRRMRELRPGLPIVAISGVGTMDDVIRVLRAGANDYLKKPIQPKDLEDALQRIFEGPKETSGRVAALTAEPEQIGPTPDEQLEEALEELRSDEMELPPAPTLLPAIRALMEDLTCGVDPILAVVGKDAAVAGNVLRTAKMSHRIKEGNLRDVALKVGNRKVLATAHEVVLRDTLGVTSGPLARVGKKLWANVQVTARGAQELAELMGLPDPEGFYVDGLLHNVGEVIMLKLFSKRLTEDAVGGLGLERLAEEISKAHQQVGRRVLEAWGMPPHVVRVAAFHHRDDPNPEDTMAKVRRMVVLAAWALAQRAGFTYLPGPKVETEPLVRALRLDPERVTAVFSGARSWAGGG